jgi:cation-transporting ATPase E
VADATTTRHTPDGPASRRTPPSGLTAPEVDERRRRGAVNVAEERTSRSVREIVRANVFTRFNALLGTLFVLILIVGPAQDALFGFVLLFNALIGIVQEWRAKRTLDKLAVLSAPKARVVRDGDVHEIAVGDIVLDDLVDLRAGDQVPADGTVVAADGLEIDESMLTGESDPSRRRSTRRCCRAASSSRGAGGSRRRAWAWRPMPASSRPRPVGSRSCSPS